MTSESATTEQANSPGPEATPRTLIHFKELKLTVDADEERKILEYLSNMRREVLTQLLTVSHHCKVSRTEGRHTFSPGDMFTSIQIVQANGTLQEAFMEKGNLLTTMQQRIIDLESQLRKAQEELAVLTAKPAQVNSKEEENLPVADLEYVRDDEEQYLGRRHVPSMQIAVDHNAFDDKYVGGSGKPRIILDGEDIL